MFHDLSTADTVHLVAAVFAIVTVTVFGLILLAILAPERLMATSEQMTAPFAPGEYGQPAAFREPAEPSYVDALTRAQGRVSMPTAERYASLAELTPEEPVSLDDIEHPPVSPAKPFSMTLAELRDSARYVVPIATPNRQTEYVGRRRAPERVLVGAAA